MNKSSHIEKTNLENICKYFSFKENSKKDMINLIESYKNINKTALVKIYLINFFRKK